MKTYLDLGAVGIIFVLLVVDVIDTCVDVDAVVILIVGALEHLFNIFIESTFII